MQDKKELIIDNWMEFHPVITKGDLGWSEECIRDAMSEDPKEIYGERIDLQTKARQIWHPNKHIMHLRTLV